MSLIGRLANGKHTDYGSTWFTYVPRRVMGNQHVEASKTHVRGQAAKVQEQTLFQLGKPIERIVYSEQRERYVLKHDPVREPLINLMELDDLEGGDQIPVKWYSERTGLWIPGTFKKRDGFPHFESSYFEGEESMPLDTTKSKVRRISEDSFKNKHGQWITLEEAKNKIVEGWQIRKYVCFFKFCVGEPVQIVSIPSRTGPVLTLPTPRMGVVAERGVVLCVGGVMQHRYEVIEFTEKSDTKPKKTYQLLRSCDIKKLEQKFPVPGSEQDPPSESCESTGSTQGTRSDHSEPSPTSSESD